MYNVTFNKTDKCYNNCQQHYSSYRPVILRSASLVHSAVTYLWHINHSPNPNADPNSNPTNPKPTPT